MARKARAEMIEETRQKLVAAARQQFGSVGYAETVMDELTAQAGMTRGALYHHFGDFGRRARNRRRDGCASGGNFRQRA